MVIQAMQVTQHTGRSHTRTSSLLPLRGSLLLLLQPVLFILNLPPIRRNRLITIRLLETTRKRRPPRVKLVSLVAARALRALHGLVRNGRVAAEALAHVDHAALALAVALFQLLALQRECVDEGLAQAVGGFVAMDHDAVGLLEAFGQRLACEKGLAL